MFFFNNVNELFCFKRISNLELRLSRRGEYRSRTDDLLRARQAL